jgi:hypothetical protein
VDEHPPNSSQGKAKKTKRVAKKAKKKTTRQRAPRVKKNLNEPYIWLLKQLKDKSNSDLNTQRGSALLEHMLNTLQAKEKVSENQVFRFLEKVKTDMNLKEVMQYFKIRRNKPKK